MKFELRYASDSWGTPRKEIEINTLEELMALIKECGDDLIISEDREILVYDDYIE